jgi:hypothetical protein
MVDKHVPMISHPLQRAYSSSILRIIDERNMHVSMAIAFVSDTLIFALNMVPSKAMSVIHESIRPKNLKIRNFMESSRFLYFSDVVVEAHVQDGFAAELSLSHLKVCDSMFEASSRRNYDSGVVLVVHHYIQKPIRTEPLL